MGNEERQNKPHSGIPAFNSNRSLAVYKSVTTWCELRCAVRN